MDNLANSNMEEILALVENVFGQKEEYSYYDLLTFIGLPVINPVIIGCDEYDARDIIMHDGKWCLKQVKPFEGISYKPLF